MEEITGRQLIAGEELAGGTEQFSAIDPATGRELDPTFLAATPVEIQQACEAAHEAFLADRFRPPRERAALLMAVADAIEAMGDALIERVMAETALPEGRVRGERGRTTGQLRMFGELVREGTWVDARIDTPMPDRSPAPRPDLRRMLVALGPVAVFGASNFPLAFSVAGGDTASALAAGCPVVVKAHPSHPGTSELVGRAVARAVQASGFHPGNFSLLHGPAPAVGQTLVINPRIRAVGFTGSLRAGRALHDAAAARAEPIPVFAEMGSVNPLFVLPEALAERADAIADGLVGSVTLGAGQFCTNPGLVFVVDGAPAASFIDAVSRRIEETPAFTMLNAGICKGYDAGLRAAQEISGVRLAGSGTSEVAGPTSTRGAVLETTLETYRSHERLHEEIFGPVTLIVRCPDVTSLDAVASALEGNLTAAIHGTEGELADRQSLVAALTDRVGRVIFNGFPTGVEVSPAMQHGGPYPATTDSRSTSVGTAAIYRFARPVSFQNSPQALLPEALRDGNPLGIWRTVDAQITRD